MVMPEFRFKAPIRRVLSGGKGKNSLNDAYYAGVKAEKARSRERGLKSRQTTAVKSASGKARKSLTNKGIATRTARQRLGSAIPPEQIEGWVNRSVPGNGIALKEGIKRMATEARLSTADQELYNKLQRMDPDKLQYLYERDDLIFDVVFSYDENGQVGAGKRDDLRFLVDSYEKAFGALRGDGMARKPRFNPENVLGFDTETDNDGSTAWICQWCIHDGRIPYIGKDCSDLEPTLLSLAQERGSIILYVFNLKYDLEFIKPVIHDLEAMGWDSAIIMRKGSPIKVALQREGTIIEFRDAMKKMPGNLKSLGRMVGLPKLESPYGFEPGWSSRIDYSVNSKDFLYV